MFQTAFFVLLWHNDVLDGNAYNVKKDEYTVINKRKKEVDTHA